MRIKFTDLFEIIDEHTIVAKTDIKVGAAGVLIAKGTKIGDTALELLLSDAPLIEAETEPDRPTKIVGYYKNN